MMCPKLILATMTIIGISASFAAAAPLSAYAGQQTREIKALSAQEVDDLFNARGMALAQAAELNGFPGPAHTIETAKELSLTPEQLQKVSNIKARVEAAAKPLGAKIVARERELDQLFASRKITGRQVDALTAAIGKLQGQLRGIHLAAHLETTALLTAVQIARYNELRGYASPDALPAHNPPKNHGG